MLTGAIGMAGVLLPAPARSPVKAQTLGISAPAPGAPEAEELPASAKQAFRDVSNALLAAVRETAPMPTLTTSFSPVSDGPVAVDATNDRAPQAKPPYRWETPDDAPGSTGVADRPRRGIRLRLESPGQLPFAIPLPLEVDLEAHRGSLATASAVPQQSTVKSGNPYASLDLAADFAFMVQAMGLGQPVEEVDMNGASVDENGHMLLGTPNGMPDLAEILLYEALLKDDTLDMSATGGTDHATAVQRWETITNGWVLQSGHNPMM